MANCQWFLEGLLIWKSTIASFKVPGGIKVGRFKTLPQKSDNQNIVVESAAKTSPTTCSPPKPPFLHVPAGSKASAGSTSYGPHAPPPEEGIKSLMAVLCFGCLHLPLRPMGLAHCRISWGG